VQPYLGAGRPWDDAFGKRRVSHPTPQEAFARGQGRGLALDSPVRGMGREFNQREMGGFELGTGEFYKMRRMHLAAVSALLCACGSSSSGTDGGPTADFAPPFVGTWSGTLTLTETAPSTGTPLSSQESIVITEVMANTVSLNETCPDLSSLTATVTSATEFAITAPHACPATTVSTCTTVVFTYNTLTGTLSGGVLSLTGTLTAAGCGVSASSNLSFTSGPGTKK
jgi:hypothetical protein